MRSRLVLAGVIAVGLACGPRPRTAVEMPSPWRMEPSSHAPTLATEHVCGHFRMLLTVQRSLDRAEAADYLARCVATFDRKRRVMSASMFADMATCAGTAATLDAFARCARNDELLPIVAVSTPTMPPTASEQRAKEIYFLAERFAAAGRWADAIPVYEEAYYLVPGKHGLAHKIGIAAWNVGDCDKAKEYLEHFLYYGERAKYGDKLTEAKMILGEIAVSGCATR
jgi:tetratricopeptide (TPR) repeat protein